MRRKIPDPIRKRLPVDVLARQRDRFMTTEYLFVLVAAAVIGVLAGFGALGFRWLIGALQSLFWRTGRFSLAYLWTVPRYFKILIPAAGGAIVGPIIYFFAREVKGHGVPEVMVAVETTQGVIRPRSAFARTIASAVTIASGGSAGQVGPVVQLGAALGSLLGQGLRVSARRMKTLLGCGAAAGIAAIFNAPIAGALFASEVVLREFRVGRFGPVVVSSVVAALISRHFIGDFRLFTLPQYELVSVVELIPYAVLGLLAGLVGVGFTLLLSRTEDVVEKLTLPETVKPVLGGLLVGALGIFVPHVYGLGYEIMEYALMGAFPLVVFAWLLAAKLLGTTFTLGSGGSGGIFAPSLYMGGMLGGIIGRLGQTLFPSHVAGPGPYALVGMGAVVAGTIHAPLTAIVIVFELTGNYLVILPLMIACVLSSLLSKRLMRDSIYTKRLIRRGIDLSQAAAVNLFQSIRVRQVMNEEVSAIPEDLPLARIIERVVETDRLSYFVVDPEGRVRSVIHVRELLALKGERDATALLARDIAHPVEFTVTPEDSLDRVYKAFEIEDVHELPVVESEGSRKIVGVVSRADVAAAYNEEVLKKEMDIGLETTLTTVSHGRALSLGEGITLAEMDVPGVLVGRSIRDFGARHAPDLQIVLIRKERDKEGAQVREAIMPSASYVFERGDVLVVMGKEKDVKRLREG
jgi:CIC family chloride channel protein